MNLVITDPTALVANHDDVISIRAEDESGGFGVLKGHADFLTTLTLSVVSWRRADGRTHFCAVRRGVFTVTGGQTVHIATREAHLGDDLDRLEAEVVERYRAESEAELETRTESAKLRMKAIRRIVEALRGGAGLSPGLAP